MSTTRKHSLIASVAVMGSRLAGLVREVIFAFLFGASPVLDAFIAAFRIPNLLRDLFSEGALSTAFVTVFSRKMATEGDQAAWKLANKVFIFIFYFLGLITLVGILISPALVHLVASGFEGEKFALTVSLNRLLFPFILFVSWAALAMGMLNAKGKFGLPQSASTYFNFSSVLIGLGCVALMAPEAITTPWNHFWGRPVEPVSQEALMKAIYGMAVGTFCGGMIQWLVQMPTLFKMGFRLKWAKIRNDAALKEVLLLTVPAIIGGSAVQINVLINSNFASHLVDGSMSWLNFAFRLMQFPIGVFGVAIASATTPVLVKLLVKNQTDQLVSTLLQSSRMALFLCLPSALGLIAFSKPIIEMIYEHGQFSTQDTQQTAYALSAYAVGLSFYALIKIFQPAFMAYNKAKIPMMISLFSILLNLIVGYLLVFGLQLHHWGLALGTSLIAITNCLLLMLFFNKKCTAISYKPLVLHAIKVVLASLIAVGMGKGAWIFLEKNGWVNFFPALVVMLMVIIAGVGLLYMALGFWMKIEESTSTFRWLKRKFGRT